MDRLLAQWSKNPPNALLLLDSEGGQSAQWARDYLRQALCEHQNSADNCKSCHLFDLTQTHPTAHPDLHFFPEKVKTDEIRALLDHITTTPSVARYHGVFLGHIDDYNESALSALLKTLEEPLAHSIFVLSARHKRAVKPTILSRCQVVTIPPLSGDAAVAWLMKEAHINAQAAKALLYCHFGNPYQALLHLDDEHNPLATLQDCAQYLCQPQYSAYLALFDQIPDKALLDYVSVHIETLIRLKQLDSSAQNWHNFADLAIQVPLEYLEPLNVVALHTLYARLQARRRPNLMQTGQAVNLKSLFIQYHNRNDHL